MKHRILGFVMIALAVSLVCSTIALGQTLNPSYLSEMPEPSRVLNEIKGKDAEDTLDRQMGAFKALEKMIDDLAWGLEHRYLPKGATPDENKIKYAYEVAYADLWKKAANKDNVNTYIHDRPLVQELMNKLFTQSFRDLLIKSDAKAAEAYKAYREKQANGTLYNSGQVTPVTSPAGSGGPGTTAEMRRCIESGRSQRNCFSDVMSNGFDAMTGINTKTVTPGLRMTGYYRSVSGTILVFQPEKAVLTCNSVSSPLLYSVEVTDTGAIVRIDNEGKPLLFTLRPDGSLAGSGQTKIDGITANGTSTVATNGPITHTTTTTRELTPLEAGTDQNATTNGQIKNVTDTTTSTDYGQTGTARKINYENRSTTCSLGLMKPSGPTPLPPDIESPFGILTTLFSGMGTLMKGGSVADATKTMLVGDNPIQPGLRMGGEYSGDTGFHVAFHPESVTVGCGEAERASEYSIHVTGNRVALAIADKTDPITLQLKPDGSITGEGSAQVNGRTLTGTTEDPNNPFVFAPKSARCTLGRLTPGAASSLGGPPANVAPVAVMPATPAPNPGNSANKGSLSITGHFAGASSSNMFAGKPVLFLKESAEDILRRAGFVPAAGSAIRSSVAMWSAACDAKDMATCSKGIQPIVSERVNTANFTTEGKLEFPGVPAGTYWALSDFKSNGKHYVWNTRVDIRPGGSTTLTLDESNTFVVF